MNHYRVGYCGIDEIDDDGVMTVIAIGKPSDAVFDSGRPTNITRTELRLGELEVK